ncbi:MAG: CBS domain-containing protein [Gammaproteobacteria bacterium]|nr:CBS domain-containing protein [Gammaproteobacteria bacterium]
MSTVKELLDQKGRNLWSIEASASVYEAIEMMSEKNIGALTVYNDASKLTGILSERDYARKVALVGRTSRDTLVSDIMTSSVVVAHEKTLLDSCMALMIQHKIRHLPIVEHNTPIGIITLGDMTKTIIREQSETIEELSSYVFGEQGGEG